MRTRHACLLICLTALLAPGCARDSDTDLLTIQRRNMVRWALEGNGIRSKRVLDAMRNVPRHMFLPERLRGEAYLDKELSIGQFLSTPRPIVVARSIEMLDLKGTEKVLEVGTGSGYQSALLSELAKEVYTIEIVPSVAEKAKKKFDRMRFPNIHTRIGDGYQGWSEAAPFDAILVMASATTPPVPLLDQLAIGGRLVIPIGVEDQHLVLYRKTRSGVQEERKMPVQLRRMEGRAAGHHWQEPQKKN